jgi:tRNA-dihydrouridine synthase B
VTLWPTEMLNSRRIPTENLDVVPEGMTSKKDTQLVPQILGNEEGPISQSVAILESRGAVGIDINMGCPVQKALRHNYGVALMGDMNYAASVVEMAVKSTHLPVSVKLRAVGKEGEDLEHLFLFTQKLVDAGAKWICLHPRTPDQMRRGTADWSQIRFLQDKLPVPVIGNGDIQTVEDVHRMLQETRVPLVMSGRALAARPWMLWQLGEDLGFAPPRGRENEKAPRSPEEEAQEYGRVLAELAEKSGIYFGQSLALRKINFYIRMTSVWLDFGHQLVGIGAKAQDIQGFIKEIERFFQQPLRMLGRTDLRI